MELHRLGAVGEPRAHHRQRPGEKSVGREEQSQESEGYPDLRYAKLRAVDQRGLDQQVALEPKTDDADQQKRRERQHRRLRLDPDQSPERKKLFRVL